MAPKKADKKVEKKGKAKKEKGPKRALSAFMFFSIERRKQIVAEKPELKSSIAAVGKMIGEQWRNLSESQKAPYVKMAEKDKKRYDSERAAMK